MPVTKENAVIGTTYVFTDPQYPTWIGVNAKLVNFNAYNDFSAKFELISDVPGNYSKGEILDLLLSYFDAPHESDLPFM